MEATPDDLAEIKSQLRRLASDSLGPKEGALYSPEDAAVRLRTGRDPALLSDDAKERALDAVAYTSLSPRSLRELANSECEFFWSVDLPDSDGQVPDSATSATTMIPERACRAYREALKNDAVKARHRIESIE